MHVANVPSSRARKLGQNYRTCLRESDSKGQAFLGELTEAFKAKDVSVYDYGGIRCLFENLVVDRFDEPCGRDLVDTFKPSLGGNSPNLHLLEAAGEVRTSHFANITGQIVYTEVLDRFQSEEFLSGQLMDDQQTEFDGEKIPGIGDIGDAGASVTEGQQFPFAGLSEYWVDTPQTTKYGVIVPVTKEAIFFDRTGVLLERAGRVGESLAIAKEKRCLDVALGVTTTYRRNGGAAQATYGNTHTNGDFDNLVASNTLVDYTDIEAAELVFRAMTDPETGEPIMVKPNVLIVPPALEYTARRILNATEVRQGSISATVPQTHSPNPVSGYTLLCTQYVKNRTSSDSTYFIGDPKKAFRNMVNWPITVVQAPSNSNDEFHRDIVAQYKASERSVPAVVEPRYMAKCTT